MDALGWAEPVEGGGLCTSCDEFDSGVLLVVEEGLGNMEWEALCLIRCDLVVILNRAVCVIVKA